MRKTRVVLSAALIAMLALAGCGQKAAPEAPKEKTAEEIVAASYEAMADMSSYGFDMDMTMDMDLKDQGTANMKMTSKAEAILQPKMLLKMDSVMDMTMGGGSQSINMVQYVEATDTGLALYQQVGGQWMKSVVDDPALAESMSQDPQESLKMYQDSMEKAEILGEEKVNDRDCYKIQVTLSKDALDQVLGEFSSSMLDESTLSATKEVMDSIGGLAATIWIDKENYQMLKESMDISEIVRQAMVKALADEGVNEDSLGDVTMSLEIMYNNYNGIKEIVIPDEAKNAPEIAL